MLEAIRVSKKRNGRQVLRDVNLMLDKGEMVGVIGPNGCGKTTLVRLLCGEEEPDGGKVRFQGKDMAAWNQRERARQMAVLPQEGLPPISFTVEEVVAMGRHPHQGIWPWTVRDDHETVDRVLEQTGLTARRHRPVHLLSGGERQRVAIAKAMAQEPACLLLDEPTTFLDIAHQLSILDRIQRWRRECGLAVLVVFHDLNLAAQYCDRLLLMKEGAVVMEGTPPDVLRASWIDEVYGVKPIITNHPVSGVPQVLLQPQGEKLPFQLEVSAQPSPLKIHASTGRKSSDPVGLEPIKGFFSVTEQKHSHPVRTPAYRIEITENGRKTDAHLHKNR
ncbi:heme ABC transporter ATP-binding protein [Desmospora profundinema]|uniref:Iron complex transport system ATP-binding protein n=1 Tax=Desmospora profundinema TaxID=1571184 RepID=A0ABU1IMB3_9BACL|nr:heme ABC transporter ATP-binding protein [Desmospora profundinema]MDR6225915.1 iron complex transport system ATP-binding protein [Desmospora profundinema]